MTTPITHIFGHAQPDVIGSACRLMASKFMAECMHHDGIRNWMPLYVSGMDFAKVDTAQVVELAKQTDAFQARERIRQEMKDAHLRAQLLGEDKDSPEFWQHGPLLIRPRFA